MNRVQANNILKLNTIKSATMLISNGTHIVAYINGKKYFDPSTNYRIALKRILKRFNATKIIEDTTTINKHKPS